MAVWERTKSLWHDRVSKLGDDGLWGEAVNTEEWKSPE